MNDIVQYDHHNILIKNMLKIFNDKVINVLLVQVKQDKSILT